LAPALETIFRGCTSPVIANPNLISLSRTEWPPRSATRARFRVSAPPRRISRRISMSPDSGKHTTESAVFGVPPMA
jgi:hypothetical protein